MKFAALALLAVVLFSDDAEAKRGRGRKRGRGGKNAVTASCDIVPDSDDASTGGFKLYQGTGKDGTVRPISVKGKFTFDPADSEVDWSIAFF